MTNGYVTPDPVAWEQARREFEEAVAAVERIGKRGRGIIAALDRFGAAQQALLALPAPDLGAVIYKLERCIWQEDEIWDEHDDFSTGRRTVIGDLRRFQVEHASE